MSERIDGDSTSTEDNGLYTLQYRFVDPESSLAAYSNLVSVTHDEAMFQLVFAQAVQPVIANQGDVDRLRIAGNLPAYPVAKVIMSPLGLIQLMDLIQQQIKSFQDRQDRTIRNYDDEAGRQDEEG